MIAVLLFGSSILFGFFLLRVAQVRLGAEARLVVAPVLGFTAGFWIVYLLSAAVGDLSMVSVGGSVGIMALVGFGARLRPSVSPSQWPRRWFLVFLGVVGVVVVGLQLFGVMAPSGEAVLASEHIWADTPFHAAQVTAFAYGDNLPPTYTIALGHPLNYPFHVNFSTGALVYGGFGLRASWIVVNVFVQLAFFAAMAVITHRLTRSVRTAVVAVALFFLLGNLGFLAVPQDIGAAGGFWSWLGDLPWSYTGDALGDPGRQRLGTGLYLGNPVYMYLLPERSSALGFAVMGTILLLLWQLGEKQQGRAREHGDAGDRRIPWGTAVVTGVLLGILPRVQAHAVLIVAIIAGVWFALLPWYQRADGRREWLAVYRRAFPIWGLAGGVGLAIAAPELLALRSQAEGFFTFWLGWAGESHEAWEAVARESGVGRLAAAARALYASGRFWILNGGALLVLAVPAYLRAGRTMRFWYVPFGLLWIFGNVVKTQPWEWDQNNYFYYWEFGTAVLVAPFLVGLFTNGRSVSVVLQRVVGAALVVVLTVGGILSFGYWAQQRHHLWSQEEVAFATEVRERTPEDAVVLTSNGHTHPVLALSGRHGFMGFTGWLVTHNLDWETYDRRLERMFAGDVELMRDIGVDYVVLGPWERSYAADRGVGLNALEDPEAFEVVFRRTIDGREWALLRVRGP